VYLAHKPVSWSHTSHTALASAELEKLDHRCTSVYVTFPVVNLGKPLEDVLDGPRLREERGRLSLVVWTTTPWTLPANMVLYRSDFPSYVRGLTLPGR
jgi:isoleucyl-tRNA synthetase